MFPPENTPYGKITIVGCGTVPAQVLGVHVSLLWFYQLIGQAEKAETVPDPDEEAEQLLDLPAKVEAVHFTGNPPDQLYGNPASVESLWKFAKEILHDDFTLNNTSRNSLHRLPPQRMTLP